MFRVRIADLLLLMHDTRALAVKLEPDQPLEALSLNNAADTMLSAASVVLRYEEAEIPTDVSGAVLYAQAMLQKHGM